MYEENKKRFQVEFKSRICTIVDQPRQGFGTYNDRNIARWFFADSKLSFEITGLFEALITNIQVFVRVIANLSNQLSPTVKRFSIMFPSFPLERKKYRL